MTELSRERILQEAKRVADSQFGGTLATIHADDGTPYPAFVLFHLTDKGEVLYGSVTESQHTRDTEVVPRSPSSSTTATCSAMTGPPSTA